MAFPGLTLRLGSHLLRSSAPTTGPNKDVFFTETTLTEPAVQMTPRVSSFQFQLLQGKNAKCSAAAAEA